MDKKYQVFVSSTYEDLKEERATVITALLKNGFIPVCMEYFTASNRTQWEVIESIIPQCDYYVVIVAGRYGSIEETTKISYTQKEYELAYKCNVPCIGFVHSNVGSLPFEKVEEDADTREKLKEFTKLVKSRMCSFWSDKHELASAVTTSLHEQVKTTPRTGWVKADQKVNPDSKLIEENKKLHEQIHKLTEATPALAFGDDKYVIEYSVLGNVFVGEENKTIRKPFTWHQIFLAVAGSLLEPMSISTIEDAISTSLLDGNPLQDDQKKEILNQFLALDLITITHFVVDGMGPGVSCTLSDKGRKTYAQLTAKTKPHPKQETPWKNLIHYSELSKEEFESAYNESFEMLRKGEVDDAALLAHLVFTFAQLHDSGIKMSEEQQQLLRTCIYSILYNTGNQDDLYEIYLRFAQTLNGNGYDKLTSPTVVSYCNYFRTTNEELKAQFKNKMTVILENLNNDNVFLLRDLLSHAPDHGTPYSSLEVFNHIDIEKLFKGITTINEKARYELGLFLGARYNVIYDVQVVEPQFTVEANALAELAVRIKEHVDTLDSFSALSYRELKAMLAASICRCAGELRKQI